MSQLIGKLTKVKLILEQAIKFKRWSRGTDLLFL